MKLEELKAAVASYQEPCPEDPGLAVGWSRKRWEQTNFIADSLTDPTPITREACVEAGLHDTTNDVGPRFELTTDRFHLIVWYSDRWRANWRAGGAWQTFGPLETRGDLLFLLWRLSRPEAT